MRYGKLKKNNSETFTVNILYKKKIIFAPEKLEKINANRLNSIY